MNQTSRLKDRYSREIILIEAMASVGLMFLAWCFATISYKGQVFGLIHLLLTTFFALFYTRTIYNIARYDYGIKAQVKAINILEVVAFILMLLGDVKSEERQWYFITADIIAVLAGVYGIKILSYNMKKISLCVLSKIKENIPVIVLLTISLILAIEPFELQFRWDGSLYEQACRVMDIHSLSSLGAYGHLSQAYGSLYCLVYALINNTGMAMAVLNIVLYLSSIVGFYLLIKMVDVKGHDSIYLSGTAVYAFSPFLLGMVNYYSLDYAALCLFVWVIYFAYTQKWAMHFVAAVCFTFTKEPSVVVYGAFCVGIVLIDFFKCEHKSLLSKLIHLFKQYQYYLMVLVAVLWIAVYMMIGGWSGGAGEFALDVDYIFDKLKAMYILNFNWLVIVGILIGVFLRINKKCEQKLAGLIIPILFSLAMYTVFNIAFKTVNHARYTATVPVILYLILFWTLVSIIKKNVSIIFVVFSVVMLISCHMTIDPVSLICFENINTGAGKMITTGAPAIGDSMIYNKQMLRQEYALNKALNYAIDNSYKIYMPTYSGSTYSFDGMEIPDKDDGNIKIVTQYWNNDEKKRVAYQSDTTEKFELYEIVNETEVLEQMISDDKSCYIYSDILGYELASNLVKLYPNLVKKEFKYGEWVVYMLEF